MKSNTCAVSLLLASGLAAPAGLIAAQPATIETTKVDFITVDKDNNGSLSREEAEVIADLKSAFAELDADHDGAVSPPEFQRWKRAGKVSGVKPADPATAPTGSAGAQHMPETN